MPFEAFATLLGFLKSHTDNVNMPMLEKLSKARQDPGLAWTWACTRVAPRRAARRAGTLARRAGLHSPVCVLSFDCDTDADSLAAERLHCRLRSGGLSPLYAVAGEVLAAGITAYRAIAEDGGVFLNHGFRRHAAVDPFNGTVASTYFYGAVNAEDWQRDIRHGHEAVVDILGQIPDSFRI